MRTIDFQPPVRMLYVLGIPKDPWLNYWALGIGLEHVPGLVRALEEGPALIARDDEPAMYAPVHAWRALAQMHAPEGVAPILRFVRDVPEADDLMVDELPHVFGMLGEPALEPLAAYCGEIDDDVERFMIVSHGLMEIGFRNPPSRNRCVEVLSRELDRAERRPPAANSFAVLALLGLDAIEAEPVIKKAYRRGFIDESGFNRKKALAHLHGDPTAMLPSMGMSDEDAAKLLVDLLGDVVEKDLAPKPRIAKHRNSRGRKPSA